MRVKYEDLLEKFQRILESRGFSGKHAEDAATVFANNSLDGVYSHGVNRFPRVVEYLDKGEIDSGAIASCESSMGAIERWNGHRGFGPLNAKLAMDRAVELAREYGVGVVALGNNNHWMRGGSYGWQAAEKGYIGICWTNSIAVMPPWGAKECRIGTNPLIVAIPSTPITMVDMSMSMFSYGMLEVNRLAGRQLPVEGGFDDEGKLTKDPARNAAGRRKAFYPYAAAVHGIEVKMALRHSDIDNLAPEDISLQFGPATLNEEIETWKDVYGIEERFKAKISGENDGLFADCLLPGRTVSWLSNVMQTLLARMGAMGAAPRIVDAYRHPQNHRSYPCPLPVQPLRGQAAGPDCR